MKKKDTQVRSELAALYRILNIYGMTDLANQCAAARSSENKDTYFVHQYGMFYDEITASSLIEIDKNGKPKDPN
jgi:ribulose-5-phosphate 4-epimerase/fuculose-1-phosphate aldolase